VVVCGCSVLPIAFVVTAIGYVPVAAVPEMLSVTALLKLVADGTIVRPAGAPVAETKPRAAVNVPVRAIGNVASVGVVDPGVKATVVGATEYPFTTAAITLIEVLAV
jgi:hypothetical protein